MPADVVATPAFAALVVEAPSPEAPPVRKSQVARAQSQTELVVAGIAVRVGADVDETQLTRVIRAVRAAGT